MLGLFRTIDGTSVTLLKKIASWWHRRTEASTGQENFQPQALSSSRQLTPMASARIMVRTHFFRRV
jgi:hypothetical protein